MPFLLITDACEGVEVFVNGVSLGLQIVPTYRYDLTDVLKAGANTIAIEVATTLEREAVDFFNPFAAVLGEPPAPSCPSGINGVVRLYSKD